MAILDVKGLRKSFGTAEILKGIDFELEKGKTLAIIGSSGSGKTTLLRCLNFLEKPNGGTITVGGEVLYDGKSEQNWSESEIRRRRLRFGLVFQSFNLFPQYTALRNVTLAPELMAAERPDFKQRKAEILGEIEENGMRILADVGLADKAMFYPHQLSGGQQQRVAIARALAMSPEILCFDEPTSALDPELTGEVLRVIKGLADDNRTMIIVTHEMQFARDVADIVMFMDGGMVCEIGTPDEVFGNPKAERTRHFLERYSSTY